MPELRQLRVFVAVAEELNFTHAAERLHLGQQAVSKSVQQLERELGVALLERTTRDVRLTPAGTALLTAGRETLTSADAAFQRARTVGRGVAGIVRVGLSPAVGPAVREEVVRVLREGATELSVSLHEVRPGEVPRLLRDRDVDLVLARTAPDAPDVDSASLRPSPVVLCLPAGHRLAGATAVRLAELDGERLLTWSAPGTPYTDLLLRRLAAAGADVQPVQSRVTGAAGLSELAGSGAVALVPAGWPRGEGIVQLPLEDEVSLPLLVLWPAGAPPPAVHRVRAGMSTLTA
jgi:DNA-binding transcriptional LysR family regulator